MVPSFHGNDDFVWVGCPCKGFGDFIGFGHEAIDGGLEIDERVEDAAFEPLSFEFGEETLDGVEPGGVGVNPRHPYLSGSMRHLQALGTLPKTGHIVCYKIRIYHSPLTEGLSSLVNAGFLR